MKTFGRRFSPGWPRARTPAGAPTEPRSPMVRLAQWAAAAFGAAAMVALLAFVFFTGLTAWRPGWRVAQAPSLTHERAMPPDEARRKSDDTRILVR